MKKIHMPAPTMSASNAAHRAHNDELDSLLVGTNSASGTSGSSIVTVSFWGAGGAGSPEMLMFSGGAAARGASPGIALVTKKSFDFYQIIVYIFFSDRVTDSCVDCNQESSCGSSLFT